MNMQLRPHHTLRSLTVAHRDDRDDAMRALANRVEILCQLADNMHDNIRSLEKITGHELSASTGFEQLNFQVYEVLAAVNAMRATATN